MCNKPTGNEMQSVYMYQHLHEVLFAQVLSARQLYMYIQLREVIDQNLQGQVSQNTCVRVLTQILCNAGTVSSFCAMMANK